MTQLALFPDSRGGPTGLRYQPEFISEAAENEIVSIISQLPLQPFQFGAFEGKRRVASFGFRYDYEQRKLREADPIPAGLIPIIASGETFAEPPTGSARRIHC